jgi:hypothetical protein
MHSTTVLDGVLRLTTTVANALHQISFGKASKRTARGWRLSRSGPVAHLRRLYDESLSTAGETWATAAAAVDDSSFQRGAGRNSCQRCTQIVGGYNRARRVIDQLNTT